MQAIIWGVCLTTERGGKGEWAETERGKGMILLISSIFENWDLCFLFIIFHTPKKLSLYDVQIPQIIKSGQKEETECNSLWIIISHLVKYFLIPIFAFALSGYLAKCIIINHRRKHMVVLDFTFMASVIFY
jgi:Na+/H+ antiporter NhaA